MQSMLKQYQAEGRVAIHRQYMPNIQIKGHEVRVDHSHINPGNTGPRPAQTADLTYSCVSCLCSPAVHAGVAYGVCPAIHFCSGVYQNPRQVLHSSRLPNWHMVLHALHK
jgi:hypothetical protein